MGETTTTDTCSRHILEPTTLHAPPPLASRARRSPEFHAWRKGILGRTGPRGATARGLAPIVEGLVAGDRRDVEEGRQ